MAEDQKQRFISRIMTDPEKAALVKNPIKVGMTFKEQLAKEDEARKEYDR